MGSKQNVEELRNRARTAAVSSLDTTPSKTKSWWSSPEEQIDHICVNANHEDISPGKRFYFDEKEYVYLDGNGLVGKEPRVLSAAEIVLDHWHLFSDPDELMGVLEETS